MTALPLWSVLMRAVCQPIWCAIFFACALPSAVVACDGDTPKPVTVTDGVAAQIGCAIHILRLPRSEPDLDAARAEFETDQWTALGQPEFSFELESDAFWLTFALENATKHDRSLIIDFGLPYITDLHVWAAERDKAAFEILTDGADRQFKDRSIKNRMILSPPVTVAAGETTRIWIYAAFDGPATLPIAIYPDGMATEVTLKRDFPLLIFVSVSATLLLVLIAFTVVLRARTVLYYAGFFAGVLAYNAQLSGLLFAYVWPAWPHWNAVASHPIGLIAVVFALLFARAFIRSVKRRPAVVWTIRVLIAFCLAFIVAPLFLPLTSVKSLAGLIILAFLCVQLWAAIIAIIDKVSGSGFYLAGTLVLFAYLGSFTLASQIEAVFGPKGSGAFLRYGQLLDGAIFCVAAFRQTWELRQREIATRIQGARVATELASTRHDLRQPLLSMRTTMDKILREKTAGDEETRAKLVAGLSYIEGIVEGPGETGSKDGVLSKQPERPQTDVPLQLLLENIVLMFEGEADRMKTKIHVVETSIVVTGNGLDLFRILSNLVSNAVQHSQSDRILIGVRHINETVALEVLDRGIGLKKDPDQACTPSSGEGLGLDIVANLCEQNGWVFSILNTDRPGTHIRVGGIKRVCNPT